MIAALLGGGFAAFALGAPHSPAQLHAAVGALGPLAPMIALAAWIVLTPVLVSTTLLAAAGGLAFGLVLGSGVALIGAVVGGLLAFAIARRFGHHAAQQLSGPRLTRLQDRLAGRGFLTVLTARLAPGVPSTWLHYACGLSRIRARDFTAGIAVGGAPKLFAYVSLGASGGDLSSAPAIIGLSMIVALALIGVGVAFVTRVRTAPTP